MGIPPDMETTAMMREGIHSVIPLHTTHTHVEELPWPSGQSLRDAWLYGTGQTPPNYPVPAVRTDVEIFPDRVIYWTKRLETWWDLTYLASR